MNAPRHLRLVTPDDTTPRKATPRPYTPDEPIDDDLGSLRPIGLIDFIGRLADGEPT